MILDKLMDATVGRAEYADFRDVVGRWTADPACDEILSSQRQIAGERWDWDAAPRH